MFEKEIRKFDWKISKDLKIVKINIENVPFIEQECYINIMKEGFNKDNSPEIRVDCSHQSYITKLKKSKLFLLNEILISSKNIDKEDGAFILQIKGIMPINGITIRKKQIVSRMTNEQRKLAAENLKKIRSNI